jgi:ribosomal protein S18 acetylase RimI-like enzyme
MIKTVERDDLEKCLTVIHRGFETVAQEFGLTRENCPNRGAADLPFETLESEFSRGDLMFVLIADSKYVGFISVAKRSDAEYKIRYLVVLPEHRHRGYGKALLDHAKETVSAFGIKKLTLGMNDDNIRLKNWYIENGFKTVSTKHFDGAPFTTGYMETELQL